MSDWRQISNPPGRHIRVLIYGFRNGSEGADRYIAERDSLGWFDGNNTFRPTHWAPLPEPPK